LALQNPLKINSTHKNINQSLSNIRLEKLIIDLKRSLFKISIMGTQNFSKD